MNKKLPSGNFFFFSFFPLKLSVIFSPLSPVHSKKKKTPLPNTDFEEEKTRNTYDLVKC